MRGVGASEGHPQKVVKAAANKFHHIVLPKQLVGKQQKPQEKVLALVHNPQKSFLL